MIKFDYVGKCLLVESENEKILVIGDLHLGYLEGLRNSGILIPGNLFKEVVRELNSVFKKVGKVDEVVLLGDLKHEFGKILRDEWKEIRELLNCLEKHCKKIIIVRGNHDKITEVVTGKKGIGLVDFYIYEDIVFVHGDKDFTEINKKEIKYWIMGYGHPAVRITDGIKEEKYKCFLVGKFENKKIVIVPSFFGVNEGSDPRDYNLGMAWDFDLVNFNVGVVGESLKILDFGKLGKLK